MEYMTALGRYHPRAKRSLPRLEVIKDIPYCLEATSDQRLDLWRLKSDETKPRPVIFLVHGGGFRVQSRRTHWWFAMRFAEAGYLVANIDYRRAHRHPFPTPVEDTLKAYQWLIQHISAYGGDPQTIALIGESAGANLILSLTLANCFKDIDDAAQSIFELNAPPKAILPLCGFLEVSRPERFASRPMPALYRNRIQQVSRTYLKAYTDLRPEEVPHMANPLLAMESTRLPDRPIPPTYLAVGTNDPIEDDTLRLAAALQRREVEHTLDVYPNEPHAFHMLAWRKAAEQCWDNQFKFLRTHFEEPEATPQPLTKPSENKMIYTDTSHPKKTWTPAQKIFRGW